MADASAQPKPSSSVKLVLLGEAAVGKSSLVMRFVNNDFQENKEPTIGGTCISRARRRSGSGTIDVLQVC